MKKNSRKGFTITELVIVIAVIAILAAVLIPTFSGIISKANESAALQKAKNAYTDYIGNIDYAAGESAESNLVINVDGYVFVVTGGSLDDTAYVEAPDAAASFTVMQITNGTLETVPAPAPNPAPNPAP